VAQGCVAVSRNPATSIPGGLLPPDPTAVEDSKLTTANGYELTGPSGQVPRLIPRRIRNYIAPVLKVRNDWPIVEVPDADRITCILRPQFQEAIAAWLKKHGN
jgi:hypothetical protein